MCIRDRDSRSVCGQNASQTFNHTLGSLPARSEVGLQLRYDRIRVGLFDTGARKRVAAIPVRRLDAHQGDRPEALGRILRTADRQRDAVDEAALAAA